MGKRASIATVSSSIPRNSREVVSQTVFSGWKVRPRACPNPCTHSVAALAMCGEIDRGNMARKLSR